MAEFTEVEQNKLKSLVEAVNFLSKQRELSDKKISDLESENIKLKDKLAGVERKTVFTEGDSIMITESGDGSREIAAEPAMLDDRRPEFAWIRGVKVSVPTTGRYLVLNLRSRTAVTYDMQPDPLPETEVYDLESPNDIHLTGF